MIVILIFKNILLEGEIELRLFELAVFLGIALSLWVDSYQKNQELINSNHQILNRLYQNLEVDSLKRSIPFIFNLVS